MNGRTLAGCPSSVFPDAELARLLRVADDAASVAHDFIYERNGVTKQEASDAIWCIHNSLRPLFEDEPEP